MGGAFTALTDDPAATPFYNPATTVLTSGHSFSSTVNVYNKYVTNIGEGQDFAEAPQRLNRGGFRSLPAASGTILNFKSFAFGLSILVPDYDFYSGQIKGTGDTTAFVNRVDETLWIGTTFSARMTKEDALGLSVYYTARSLSMTSSDRSSSAGSAVLSNEEKNLTANAVVSIFGYHRKLTPLWSLGVSYRLPSLPVAGEAAYYRSVTTTSPYASDVLNRSNLRAITKIPSKFSLGIAREDKGKNTLSLDLSLYEGISYRDLPELPEGAEQIDHLQTLNIAVGYEQVIREWLSLRLGFFTNRSSHPSPDLNSNLRQGDNIDLKGFSANLSVRTKEGTRFTFGGYYNEGKGNSTQLVGQQLAILPKSQQVFTMLVATGFAF
jgi:hypothetical protein